MKFLDKVFRLRENKTNVRTEVLAGLVTFMTMAYIIFVNPAILSEGAQMDFGAVMLATCISSAFATLLMGLVARYPIALAPGMGLNAFFSYEICGQMGVPWQIGLGVVFLSGVIFTILTVARIREVIVRAIPRSLKFGIAAGIGIFIAFIGLEHAGIIVKHPETLVGLGNLRAPYTLVAVAGIGIAAALMALRVKGAILLAILATGVIAIIGGVVEAPESVIGLPRIQTPTFLALDLAGVFQNLHIFLAPILILLFFDMFDTIGTLIGVSEQAGLLDCEGQLPRASRALLADSVGTMAGAVAGTSTVTSYIESASGVAEGGRTGLANVVTAALFVGAIFFAPIVALFGGGVPVATKVTLGVVTQTRYFFPVTAPALVMVGVLMMRNIAKIDWADMTDAIPAFLTVTLMPLTFSIANGLAIGFISYPLVKLLGGKWREVHWLVYVLGALFLARYVFLPSGI